MPDRTVEGLRKSHARRASSLLKARVDRAVREVECREISHALALYMWNRAKVARVLGISYKALLYKIAFYEIAPVLPEFRVETTT